MKRMAIAAVLAMAACTQAPQTYRDLDQLGRDYERESTSHPPAPSDRSTAQDTCGASRFRNLMGAPERQIDRATLPAGTRIIRPGQMVTMDFNALRLNIRIAPDGKVAALECF